MRTRPTGGGPLWAIVVGDDCGPEWAPNNHGSAEPYPVQYSRLGETTTLMQQAIRRAAGVAPPTQVIVTLRAADRTLWEPALCLVRPERRIIAGERCNPWVTSAAAILSVLMRAPAAIVAIFPARSYVTHERPLAEAIDRAVGLVPFVPEGVVTLGMIDIDDGLDEDYLVPAPDSLGPGLALQGVAKQPVTWVAQHLRRQGALVASEILIGYVGAFAAHVTRTWPGLYSRLYKFQQDATVLREETRVDASAQEGVSSGLLRTFRWYPPSLPQRAIVVRHCGWSSLRSPRAAARISAGVGTHICKDEGLWIAKGATT